MTKIFFVLLTLLSFGVSAETWTVNPAHSELFFEVPYLKWTDLTGRFESFSGTMKTDDNVPREIFVKIETASVDTANDMRDGHLKGADFFQSKIHPYILFHGNKIQGLGKGEYAVSGKLTIKGKTRSHSVSFKLSEEIKDTWNYQNRFAKFSTTVSRKAFGFNWNKTLEGDEFLIGDDITIRGSFQLQPVKGSTPNSKHMIPDTQYIRGREKILRGESQEVRHDTRTVVPRISTTPEEVRERKIGIVENLPKEEKDFTWWCAYLLLGMMGFCGVAIIGIYAKKALLKVYSEKYQETGLLGNLSDLLIIVLVFIYSWAFWYVGWG